MNLLFSYISFISIIPGQTQAQRQSLNRFDPKYASFGPRAPRLRPAAPQAPLATFAPEPPRLPQPTPDKYATVRPQKRAAEQQPLSAAALEYRSLQRPRRQQTHQQPHQQTHQQTHQQNRRRPPPHDQRDLYAVTEL